MKKRPKGAAPDAVKDEAADCQVSNPAPTMDDVLQVFEQHPRGTMLTAQDIAAEMGISYPVAGRLCLRLSRLGELILGKHRRFQLPRAVPGMDWCAPAPAPDTPSGATPDAAASAPQTPSGPPAFGGMTVDWFSPKIGRVGLSEVGVLQALEDLDDEPRARVLTYAVARWFV